MKLDEQLEAAKLDLIKQEETNKELQQQIVRFTSMSPNLMGTSQEVPKGVSLDDQSQVDFNISHSAADIT